jgi:hypothetical protein
VSGPDLAGCDHGRAVQAKDIPDTEILRVVYDLCRESAAWAVGWHVCERLPGFPEKVVQAKLARQLKRGLMTGCPCGCRGDWELTARGYEVLGVKPWRSNPMER